MDEGKNLISSIDSNKAKTMIADQSIKGGMIPKIECALSALGEGVEKVHIINGKRRHSLLLELFTNQGIGTEVML
jgi:acetylglutamate kinase